MTAVHHHAWWEAFRRKERGRSLYRRLVVVWLGTASQDNVAILVAGRRYHRRFPGFRNTQKLLWTTRRDHGIHRYLHVSAGAVLKSHRARQPRRQLAMHLALGRTRANRGPTDKISDVLRGHWIDELRGRRHTEAVDLEQQAPCEPQAVIDL